VQTNNQTKTDNYTKIVKYFNLGGQKRAFVAIFVQTSESLNSRIVSPPALLALAVCCVTLIPPLLGRGGFIDSLMYASVCRNLSMQDWYVTRLSFSSTFYSEFAEQPPLMFWLGSWWFRLMGDHPWTEKCFSLLLAVATLFAFHEFWKRNVPGHENRHGWGWWMLLWCLVPGPLWGLGQFMLENPLTLFCFLAVGSAMGKNGITGGIGLGLFTWLALITKGPPALFPLATPVLLWLCRFRKFKEMVRLSALSGFVFGLLCLSAWQWSAFRYAMEGYWQRQVQAVFTGERPSYEVGSERTRLDMISTFFQEMLLPLAVLVICFFFYRWIKSRVETANADGCKDDELRKYALFFLLVALSASAPLFVSPKLHPHYLIPSYPWWTLALSCAVLPMLRQLPFHTVSLSSLRHRILLNMGMFSCVLGCLAYAWTKRDLPVRDLSLQADLEQLVQSLHGLESGGGCSGIAIAAEIHHQHSIWLYMQRYYGLSLNPRPTTRQCLVLVAKGSVVAENYDPILTSLNSFDVYRISSGSRSRNNAIQY